ncbi:MFS general substrate transporter [Atractiella rhizophila]|nr:MFS general substrate transporter [Atractiella rhizophila]
MSPPTPENNSERRDSSDSKFQEKAQHFDDAPIQPKQDIRLDSGGLPLIPQPTNDPADPLNWTQARKWTILTLVSVMAFASAFNLAVGNPAFVLIGQAFGVSTIEASYPATVSVATAGIGSFIWIPLAHAYGRRPVILFTYLASVAATVGSGRATTYGTFIVGRAFTGILVSALNALGVSIVGDLFFLHERGKTIGFFTVFLTNGPHVASLPGGYIAQYVGWRWTLYLPAIFQAVLVLIAFFALPETLYVRGHPLTPTFPNRPSKEDMRKAITRRLSLLPLKQPGRQFQLKQCLHPFVMFRYPVVPIIGFYYGAVFALGSVMPAFTCAKLFHELYGYKAGRTGLVLSLSTTIGGVAGELVAGPVIDRLMATYRKRNEGKVIPEWRLYGMWPGAILLPIGLIIFGVCIHFSDRVSVAGPAAGAAITCFAVQVVTTPAYSYREYLMIKNILNLTLLLVTDCYKPQAGECAQILNFVRQELAMTVSFWALRYGEKVGFQWSDSSLAIIMLAMFVPVIALMKFGPGIREKSGSPQFNQGI